MASYVMPNELAEIIALHREMFGGYVMEADPEPEPTPDGSTEDPKAGEAEAPADLGDAGKKALAAEREARKAAESELKAMKQQIADASKSAEQKAAEALAAAQKSAEDATSRALRYEVAAEKGIDLKLAGRLSGATREELEADADQLKALLSPAQPSGPKPDPRQGMAGDPKPKSLTEAITAHYA